jgi:chromosome segregation protein
VLGEQGAKVLRGGKMDDVIFAGTSDRAPLGRAEVTLTIDNADGALPIDYTEVSITRRMFRDGVSEYEINGASSRLLDIQELLSDSGIGREMHVIVGQGRLDSVLQARPEERRGFVEEAAGVLKHRKRKERALRKIDSMQANLNRLSDLTAELRRQLTPLGRQAEVARRAAGVQSELRDARLRVLADDLVALRSSLAAELAEEQSARAQRASLEQELAADRAREADLERLLADATPALIGAQQTWYELSALEERFRATAAIARERRRHLLDELSRQRSGRDPDALLAEAAQIRREHAALVAALDASRAELAAAVDLRQQGEEGLAAAERAVVVAARAVADRREGLARLAGQVNALRTRVLTGREEQQRLLTAAAAARERGERALTQLRDVEADLGGLDAGEVDLDGQHEAAVAAHERAAELVAASVEARRAAEQQLSTWTARRDALALGLKRKDGAAAVLAARDAAVPAVAVLGSLAELISVEPGFDVAVAGALGPFADAVVLGAPADAAAALALLKDTDGGRSYLLMADPVAADPVAADPVAADAVVSGATAGGIGPRPPAPAGARWAIDVVTAPAPVAGCLHAVLDGIAVVADLPAAERLVDEHPFLRAVTRAGDLFGAMAAVGGSATAPSLLEVQAAVDEADARIDATARDVAAATVSHAALVAAEAERRAAVERTLADLNASDAQLSALAEQLAELHQSARAAQDEADRLDAAALAINTGREQELAGLAELEQRLAAAQAAPVDEEPDTDVRDDLRARLARARQLEVDARLSVRSAEERVRALAGRAESLERAAATERAARQRENVVRAQRARAAEVAGAVQDAAGDALTHIAASLALAADRRDERRAGQGALEAELAAVRVTVRDRAQTLDRLTDSVHRDEVLRAEQRLRIEQAEQRAADDFGVEADALIAEYGPDQPVPPSAQERTEFEQARARGESVVAPQPGPFHRPTQEKRAARAERDLALLGKVNPLALEEFAALEERHQFLATQLEDVKNTRRDLLSVVREVDDRILAVFTAAYHDVAREFEIVFATLFPGGQGRLVLTEPDNMLATGIEVEARPPGKKVKRLSLLSGGERSLTAVALLVAIFRARPSPFYVLDEVEAALDDVNLGRLITLIDELRAGSQLIVITHQKRTMEIADALYGIAMRGNGISSVISQRLRTPDRVRA